MSIKLVVFGMVSKNIEKRLGIGVAFQMAVADMGKKHSRQIYHEGFSNHEHFLR